MTVWRSRVASEKATQGLGLTHQGALFSATKKLFPGFDIINNARKDTSVKTASGKFVEVDLWIPQLNLCLEFQDLHHYTSTWYSQKDVATVQARDNIKRDMVLADKRSFVAVPCWWDGYTKRIAATISFYRPDIVFPDKIGIEPIPLNPSAKFMRNSYGHIPEIGELMLASFPEDRAFLGTISADSPWWLGEKYDGVRFCWNPKTETLYSRKGLQIELAPELTSLLPDIFLDGELWFGRGSFSDAQKLIKTIDFNAWWFFRMPIFDTPSRSTEKMEFENRYNTLLANIGSDHPFGIIVSRVLCSDETHLQNTLKAIVNKGGEGIIIRQPRSMYEHGRSKCLFKLKVMRGDSEAIVLAVNEDQSMNLKLPSGGTFIVPPQNVKAKPLPKKGDVVTFSYDDFSRKALPVNPTIYQIRQDLAWDDVVENYLRDPQSQFLNKSSQLASGFVNQPTEFWNAEIGNNMRNFLEEYAWSKNMDPLLPETWYSLSISDMKNEKALSFVQYYSGGFVKAIMNLFPDIGLEETKFLQVPKNYWLDVDKRRQFFIKFAETHGFDPLAAENWYHIRHGSIVSAKGGKIVLGAYAAGSMIKALVHVFPDIGLDESKFVSYPKNYWQDPAKQRQFFMWVAKKKGFDYSVAENWYSITDFSILQYKGSRIILRMYSDSLAEALLHVFPNIGLQRKKFVREKLDWNSESKRKQFFIDFASRQNFDPLVAENWYPITIQAIDSSVSAKKVLGYYAGDLSEALISLFPDIGLVKSKFMFVKDNFWEDMSNLRNFFCTYAQKNRFDPLEPDNWYAVALKNVLEQKEAHFFLAAFRGSVPRALVTAFPTIGLEIQKFKVLHKKRYFLQLASRFGFDALVPENWYTLARKHTLPKSLSAIIRQNGSIPKHILNKFKGMEYALVSRSGKLAVALMTCFPNLELDVYKFPSLAAKFWGDAKNRRAFFEDFAKQNGFDPLIARNWESVSAKSIKVHKNADAVLAKHANNIAKALVDLFPDIRFPKSKFFRKNYK
eukprot:Phypoly_transcript_01706.p1 GENE.Phypoly_transcript_01706~~Phypoly_transcript_01706.p1  ORF type:complete len:1010 (+),score=136.82 Phypoly_transcript_01706:80-3109(+)